MSVGMRPCSCASRASRISWRSQRGRNISTASVIERRLWRTRGCFRWSRWKASFDFRALAMSRYYTPAMGRTLGFLLLIIVVACGGYIYTKQAQAVTSIGSTPQTTIDVTAIRNDLLAIARAEQNYFASKGKYVPPDELRRSGDNTIPTRAHYGYSVETTDTAFKVTAMYSGSDEKAPKHITIDQTMALKID